MGIAFGYSWIYMLLATVGVIVAMIPEGLAGAIIAAFAVGSIAMSRRNALVKRLPAAETLGCTTVICSDKTGTLTRNEMTVVWVHAAGRDYRVSGAGYEPEGQFYLEGEAVAPNGSGRDGLVATLTAGAACNNCILVRGEQGYGIKGDPTEGALVVSAKKAGLAEISPRLDEVPFSSDLMYMATMHESGGKKVIYVKGSPEKILAMCRDQAADGKPEALNRAAALDKASEMAQEALRVIGMACKYVDEGKMSLTTDDLHGMTFLGLQGMIDPPRQEAVDAVKKP